MAKKKKNLKQGQGRHVGTMLFWPEHVCAYVCAYVSACLCVRVRACVCACAMIHTYHYSFPIIVKPLRSECCSVYGNYDVMRWQLH